MIDQRVGGGGSAGDLLGGLCGGGAENKRIRVELFVAAQNLLNRVNPIGYSRRHDLAVLRPAHGGDAGAADRARDDGRVLSSARA